VYVKGNFMLCDKESAAKAKVLSVAERKLLDSQFGPVVRRIATAALALDDQPSHAQIARRAKCSVSTVQRALKALHAAGWLKWEVGQHGNIYHHPGRSFDRPEPTFTTSPSIKLIPPPPGGGNKQKPPATTWGQVMWAMWIFHHHFAPRAKQRITERNVASWAMGALTLVCSQRRSPEQIAEVLSWIFDHHDGVLPFHPHFKHHPTPRRVTSLNTVACHWDSITKAMSLSLAGAPFGGPPDRGQ
jgi:hypothetical protein